MSAVPAQCWTHPWFITSGVDGGLILGGITEVGRPQEATPHKAGRGRFVSSRGSQLTSRREARAELATSIDQGYGLPAV